ncbi:MAG: tetratricopeptide repeat protein, partial [Proteobacteria bacterium]|nr:tetratricopeptide repeat protein [Pseudomonadota bacterium]
MILLVICLLLAAGCSWFSDEDVRRYQRQKPLAKVIDELPDLRLPVSDERKPTREEVVRAYERVYGQIIDRIENQAVGKRLADLEMFAAEEKDAAGSGEPYDQALAMYQQLVRDPEHVGQAKILYQIARVYDLKGDTPTARSYLDQLIERFPDSEYESEARFRRAEMAFSAEDYRSARDDYEAVVDKGPDTQFWMNAHYMMGWAQFKLGELEGGLSNFFTVVDVLLEKGAQPLTTTETELLNDSFRVTTLALAYLDGPATLAGEMRSLEHPHWQYLAYEKLAQDYLDKERYLDNVTTWQMFIDENPLDARAPDAHIGMIKTLIDADFPSQVQPKKEAFIRGYGIRSEFWQVHDADSRAHYVDTLKTYLQETATLNHALAQAIVVVDESDARIKAFLDSAAWYSELIETFPADPQVPDHVFLLGEAYTEAFDDEQAILAYRRLVREFPGHTNADEAGYAMVLGFTRLLDSRPDDMILF